MEWTGARYADEPEVTVATWIDAAPDQVWALVSDPEQMPATSRELERVEWEGPRPAEPVVGARFVGHNRHPRIGAWEATSQVVEVEPASRFAWEVQSGAAGDVAARWSFQLTPDGGGTRLVETARIGPGRSGLSLAIEQMPDQEQKIVFGRLSELEAAMTATLAAIKDRVETGPTHRTEG